MAVLSIEVDGIPLGVVSCDGVDIVAVRLGGMRANEEFATLDVHTSRFPSSDEHVFLIQVDSLEVAPGKTVVVRFLEHGQPVLEGQTVDELYPDSDDEAPAFDLEEARAEAVRDGRDFTPRRAGYRFSLEVGGAEAQSGESKPEDIGFSFGAYWEWSHPGRVRIDLWTWNVEDLDAQRPGRTLAREFLASGESASICVDEKASEASS